MTVQFIQTTELLQLLVKATKLGITYEVCEDEDGDYVISYSENYNTETVVITRSGEVTWNKGSWHFYWTVSDFDVRLKEQEQERIKKEKRKELIATFTQEQRDLLGL